MKKLILFALSLIVFTSCKKEETPEPSTPTPTPNPNAALYFGDADGVLVGIISITTTSTPIGPFDVEAGLATAFFPSSTGNFTTFSNAGNIAVDGTSLTITNGVYTGGVTATNPTGIDWNSSSTWSVTGQNNTPQFTTQMGTFPGSSWNITSGTPSTTSAYTFTWDRVTNADSVICTIVGGSDVVMKTVAGSATSCVFTAAEMAKIGKGSGLMQLNPYTLNSVTVSGKKIYKIRQVTKSKTITVN